MTLSARNRLAGTVRNIEINGLIAEVELELPDGDVLAATITAASAERLDLSEGDEVDAVIKASNVMIDA